MPLFAPVMITRLPVSKGMSAAFHLSLISVLDVAARALRCEYFHCADLQVVWSSALAEKFLDDLHVLVGFFVGGQVTALLEDNKLRSGYCFVDVPGCNRRDIHVEPPGDNHCGKFELWQLWSEVEGLGCFLDCGGDLRDRLEILDAAEVGVAVRFAVEEHEEVVADTLICCRGAAAAALFARGDLLQHIGVDVRQDTNNVLPCGCG